VRYILGSVSWTINIKEMVQTKDKIELLSNENSDQCSDVKV